METKLPRIISADSHVLEPHDLWWNAIGRKYGDLTPRIVDEYSGVKGRFFYQGKQYADLGERKVQQDELGAGDAGYNPGSRVAFQKEAGVDAEIMIATLMMAIMHMPQVEVLNACAGVFNDWLHEFCSHDRDRLIPTAIIPVNDVDWAIGEVDRTAAMGFKGAIVNLMPPEGCAPYRDRRYGPLWARLEEAGIPALLHIVTGRKENPNHWKDPKRLEQAGSGMLHLFHEIEDVLLDDFVLGKVLDRFPRLKVVCMEFEVNWVPLLMWRADQIQRVFGRGLQFPKLDRGTPSAYFRDSIYHGVISDPFAVAAIPEIGASQVLWGSDYPHNLAIGKEARQLLDTAFEPLDVADQRRIVADNAVAVHNL